MDNVEKRKRGAPRKGPFSGNKITFSTKITEDTMGRLAASAQASGMSVSQKGEAAVVRGLDCEDGFHRHFGPIVHAFVQHMSVLMCDPHVGTTPWAKTARQRFSNLAHDLERELSMICGPEPVEVKSPAPEQIRYASPLGRKKRSLEIE